MRSGTSTDRSSNVWPRSENPMKKSVIKLRQASGPDIGPDSILNALPAAVVVVDSDLTIIYVNNAGEQFFRASASHLKGQRLQDMVSADSPLFALIRQAREGGHAVTEYHVTLSSPRIGHHFVNVQVSPVADMSDVMLVSMQEQSIAAKIDRQLTHRGAARSVGALAAMLAHEVKNPIAGIRGAAQLLEQTVGQEDKELTRLIRDESDRVCALVDRMEVFSVGGPLEREAVNIHEVLSRARMLAQSSFGSHLRFVENYDPSLPPVYGNRDQLTQVFLNLVKNAAEAAPVSGGEVLITTAYWHGVRFAVPGSHSRVHLPLMVSVQDNGEGIPEDLKAHLFEPFVSSKPRGRGLGLALVAKIIGDHGGVIEFESQPKRTVFRVMLQMYPPSENDA
jgi:two-component system, NtrC family, nitrogen regulation sensor histidine kinase GlnL